MLGGLAPDQGAPGLHASLGDAADQVGDARRVEPPHGDVVVEEQRLGAGHDEVVDHHRHQVDPDGVQAAEPAGQVHLRPDAVGARHEHRLPVAGRVQREQPAEAADPAEHLGAAGARDDLADEVDRPVRGIEVDPGVRVADRLVGHGGVLGRGRARPSSHARRSRAEPARRSAAVAWRQPDTVASSERTPRGPRGLPAPPRRGRGGLPAACAHLHRGPGGQLRSRPRPTCRWTAGWPRASTAASWASSACGPSARCSAVARCPWAGSGASPSPPTSGDGAWARACSPPRSS